MLRVAALLALGGCGFGAGFYTEATFND